MRLLTDKDRNQGTKGITERGNDEMKLNSHEPYWEGIVSFLSLHFWSCLLQIDL